MRIRIDDRNAIISFLFFIGLAMCFSYVIEFFIQLSRAMSVPIGLFLSVQVQKQWMKFRLTQENGKVD